MYDYGAAINPYKILSIYYICGTDASVAAEHGLIPRHLSDCILQEWPGKEVCNRSIQPLPGQQ